MSNGCWRVAVTAAIICRVIARTALAVVAVTVTAATTLAAQGSAAKAQTIEPVAVVGCLKESTPGEWRLLNASDPVPSTANAPSAKELAALPKGGKKEFQLIGVGIFDLPSHRDHQVALKGLPVKAAPADRLNVTSVTMIAQTCAGKTP
jgi:hypothetical protein